MVTQHVAHIAAEDDGKPSLITRSKIRIAARQRGGRVQDLECCRRKRDITSGPITDAIGNRRDAFAYGCNMLIRFGTIDAPHELTTSQKDQSKEQPSAHGREGIGAVKSPNGCDSTAHACKNLHV